MVHKCTFADRVLYVNDLLAEKAAWRSADTGGAEVDVIVEGARLIFSRWQIQAKNTATVRLDDVAKEVGLSLTFLYSNVEFKRILKDKGSLVIDIGGTWVKGQPTRSLYHFELVIALCKTLGFHLAQEFYWYNPSKLPSPAEWVTVRRVRVKDAVNPIWWLSKTANPKASNRHVLKPYNDSMKKLLENGYKAKTRPSGHDISDNFSRDNKGAIPPT